MIDNDGYRTNVGIILCNSDRQVLWARRCGQEAWQFPQGGIKDNETPEQALYRELREEIGLNREDVVVVGRTRHWLQYKIPHTYRRSSGNGGIKGQKQIWFLLRLNCPEEQVRLDLSDQPEFDAWRWVDYWQPLEQVIDFKREVYRLALTELEPLLPTAD